jgi:polyisoprenoid-binding protein YceI
MRFLFLVLLSTFSFHSLALSTKVEFFGYKFLSKTKVGGSFKDVVVSHDKNSKNLESILKSLEVKIKTKSLETNNDGRNKNILSTLFGLKGSEFITAKSKMVNLKNDYIVMTLTIENIKKDVVFQYTKVKDTIIFSTSIDLVAFGLGEQFGNFVKKCAGYHTDENGVHKTWSSVDVTVTSKLPILKIQK